MTYFWHISGVQSVPALPLPAAPAKNRAEYTRIYGNQRIFESTIKDENDDAKLIYSKIYGNQHLFDSATKDENDNAKMICI